MRLVRIDMKSKSIYLSTLPEWFSAYPGIAYNRGLELHCGRAGAVAPSSSPGRIYFTDPASCKPYSLEPPGLPVATSRVGSSGPSSFLVGSGVSRPG